MHVNNLEKLYWLGNAAKTRIVSEILHAAPGPDKVTVFDYGCGNGGDWARILADHPHIRLVGYEPDLRSWQAACDRLAGTGAELLTGNAIETLAIHADFIVSFSVFEHVVDKAAFLNHAQRLLAPDGLCYLNYDDGHFRNTLDLAQPGTWLPAARARVRTLISPVLAGFRQQGGYQQRVAADEADRLVADAGFCIDRVDYHNLLSLKDLSKSIPEESKEEYARWWLDIELQMNARFGFVLSQPLMGDKHVLWRQMVSRTLCLRHK